MLDENDPKVRTAVFGRQVEDFLKSDIGDFLLQLARHQEQEATEALVMVDLSKADVRELITMQARIWQARSFQGWLGDAVRKGLQALEMLEEGE
jgi:hypothetical protein